MTSLFPYHPKLQQWAVIFGNIEKWPNCVCFMKN
jgi:hypothetical protein